MSVREAAISQAEALRILTEAGIDSEDARFDAGVIYSYLGDDDEAFLRGIEERAAGKPVAYIVGRQAFYKEEYRVAPDVLIPRSDTELLVEAALRYFDALSFTAGDVLQVPVCKNGTEKPVILDLCTGTGCVGISVLNSLTTGGYPSSQAVISDVSQKVLEIARENIGNACIDPSRINAVLLDVLNEDLTTAPELAGSFDLVTANPPYINRSDMRSLDREVRDFEPHLALDGGEDGLLFYPHIANIAINVLRPGGALMTEHGYDQGRAVRKILIDKGFNNVKTLKDFGGNDRVTIGIWDGGGL